MLDTMPPLNPTTPQAVSRFLRGHGYGQAMRNKAVSCHAGPQGTVTVYIYPGDPRHMVDVLNDSGYEASAAHRSVTVRGRYKM